MRAPCVFTAFREDKVVLRLLFCSRIVNSVVEGGSLCLDGGRCIGLYAELTSV